MTMISEFTATSSSGRGATAPEHVRSWNPWMRAMLRLAAHIRLGHCAIRLPDGRQVTVAGDPSPLHATVEIRRARAARRLLLGGSVGFAEAYLDGDWDSPDLAAFLELAARNESALGEGAAGLPLVRLMHRLQHRSRANSLRGSRRNIAEHYDLGNDFYALWLDPGMSYSSALFRDESQSLPDAQDEKYRTLAAMLDLRADHHVLELGCGWGGFAEHVALDPGCRVKALTLSQAQAAFARKRMRERGLDGRVAIDVEDYREVRGRFDRIASIEMFEAVGEAYWPTFFAVLRERLAVGGVAAMQVITIEEARFPVYRRYADFIQRYIFPGGMLPTASALSREISRAGLRLTDRITFGASYARTLALWHERFQQAWPQIKAMGFDERFKRTWEYYLAYCEAGFRAGSIDVCQIRLENPA